MSATASATLAAYRVRFNAARTPADRLRVFYGLGDECRRGQLVTYGGRSGRITAVARGSGMYVHVWLDGDSRSGQYHPNDLVYRGPA